MKIIKVRFKTLVSLVAIMTFMSLLVGEYVYPLPDDDTDNLPWYYRKDKQMDATQQGQANGLEIERRNAVEQDMENQGFGREEVEPELKKKVSAGGEGGIIETAAEAKLIDSTEYDVDIGSGTDQTFDENGRLLSEVINGIRHVYVGFEDVGFAYDGSINPIQIAADYAADLDGGLVLVKAGTYDGIIYGIHEYNSHAYISVRDGVSFYGGYNEDGIRDIENTPTIIIHGGFIASWINNKTEINGFTIKNMFGETGGRGVQNTYRPNYYGIQMSSCSDKFKVLNNTIISGYMGILASNSQAVIYNNHIKDCSWSAVYTSGSSLLVINNRIHGTRYGFTETYESSSIIRHNTIWAGYTIIIVHGGSTTTIDANTLYGSLNRGSSEGIRYYASSPIVTNNIIVNCRFAIRFDEFGHGACYRWGTSKLFVYNNIFYNNQATFGVVPYEYDSRNPNKKDISGWEQEKLKISVDNYEETINPGVVVDSSSEVLETNNKGVNQGYNRENIKTDYNQSDLINRLDTDLTQSPLNGGNNSLPLIERNTRRYNEDYIVGNFDPNDTRSFRANGIISGPGVADNDRLFYESMMVVPGPEEMQDGIRESLAQYMPAENTRNTYGKEEKAGESSLEAEGSIDSKTKARDARQAAKEALKLDEIYLDEETVEEFENAIRITQILESMEELFEGVDFQAISNTFNWLMTERQKIYLGYINETEMSYITIEKLLGIDLDKEKLPDRYLFVTEMDIRTKRKILVDLALRKIEADDNQGKELTENEKKALDIYKNSIKPFQDAYKKALNTVLNTFVLKIKETVENIKPASTLKDKDKVKFFFRLIGKEE